MDKWCTTGKEEKGKNELKISKVTCDLHFKFRTIGDYRWNAPYKLRSIKVKLFFSRNTRTWLLIVRSNLTSKVIFVNLNVKFEG